MSTAEMPEVVTFGCRLNIVESEAMRRLAAQAGQRDLAIVNSCGVTAEATRQARQALRRLKRERPDRRVALTGCAAEIEPAAFAIPEVDFTIPNRRKADPAFWSGLATPQGKTELLADTGPSGSHTRGFLEVQNGCDHRCTFCVIPFGRGASRSVMAEIVIERARRLVADGVPEIVLTGVDLTSYGHDLPGTPRLGTLVCALLAALPALKRLRLSSIDCVEADPELLQIIGDEPRLMPHLHLSLQSGADLILKRMKRRHSRADAIAFCHAVRSRRPDLVLGADLIVGFPTESDAHFEDSLSLIEACGLSFLHVFPYSARPGTPAARMPAVAGPIVKARAQRLRDAGDRARARHLQSRVGQRIEVLMERGGKGRTQDFTAVRVTDPPPAGRFVVVEITGHDGQTLEGVSVTAGS